MSRTEVFKGKLVAGQNEVMVGFSIVKNEIVERISIESNRQARVLAFFHGQDNLLTVEPRTLSRKAFGFRFDVKPNATFHSALNTIVILETKKAGTYTVSFELVRP